MEQEIKKIKELCRDYKTIQKLVQVLKLELIDIGMHYQNTLYNDHLTVYILHQEEAERFRQLSRHKPITNIEYEGDYRLARATFDLDGELFTVVGENHLIKEVVADAT